MDIEGAGWKVLEQLLQTGLVKRRGDFYRLSIEDLEGLDRFARKSAENLHASIQKSRRRPLERILAGLGIPQVGWTTAIELAAWLAAEVPAGDDWLRRAAAHLERIATEEPARFEEIEGIGPTVATLLLLCAGAGFTFLPARHVHGGAPVAASGTHARIGLVFDVGGRGDKSFNDAAFAGLVRAERELGVPVLDADGLRALLSGETP